MCLMNGRRGVMVQRWYAKGILRELCNKQILDARGYKLRFRHARYDMKQQTITLYAGTKCRCTVCKRTAAADWLNCDVYMFIPPSSIHLLQTSTTTLCTVRPILQLAVHHVYAARHLCEIMCPTSKCQLTRLAAGATTSIQGR